MFSKISQKFSSFSVPTIWRYFLSEYIKVFALALFGFLVLLLSTRLDDFAHFVSLGASLRVSLLYIAYQIPYVLQVALPISSLIASFFLFQKLSSSNVLTQMRAAGLSLTEIITPLLLISMLLATFTFRTLLDISARSHFKAKELEQKLRQLNPLSLLHNPKALEEGGMSIEMKGSLQRDGKSQDFIMALNDKEKEKVTLFIAQALEVEGTELKGKNLSLITTFPTPLENQFNHLVVENSKENHFHLQDLSQAVEVKRLHISDDEHTLPMLFAKKRDLSQKFLEKLEKGKRGKEESILLASCISEIARRISLSFAIISAAFLGAAFGASRSNSSRKQLTALTILTTLFLLSYLGAKAVDEILIFSIPLYFIPHVLFISAALWRLGKIRRGGTI
jgi:lipopolysaccharide export system permease protein